MFNGLVGYLFFGLIFTPLIVFNAVIHFLPFRRRLQYVHKVDSRMYPIMLIFMGVLYAILIVDLFFANFTNGQLPLYIKSLFTGTGWYGQLGFMLTGVFCQFK